MVNETKPPISFGHLDKDVILLGEFVWSGEDQVLRYLAQLETEVRNIPRDRYKEHVNGISVLLNDTRRLLKETGLGEMVRRQLDELGILQVALIDEWRGAKKRGSQPRQSRVALIHALEKLILESPKVTNRQAWESFGDSYESVKIETPEGNIFEIYKSDDKLVIVNDLTGKDHPIAFRTFDDPIAKARAKISKCRKK